MIVKVIFTYLLQGAGSFLVKLIDLQPIKKFTVFYGK